MKDPHELLREAMDKRYEMADEIWQAMKVIDYQTLAICACGVRSMSNAPSTDQGRKDEEAQGAADWAAKVWFDALALSLFLRGKIKISGTNDTGIRYYIATNELPVDAPYEFVKLLTMADGQ